MTNNNLNNKIRLSIIFAWLVFFIAFFLELFYFSFRYLNFSHISKKQEFESLTNNFVLSINKDSLFLENFLKEKIDLSLLIDVLIMKNNDLDLDDLNLLVSF